MTETEALEISLNVWGTPHELQPAHDLTKLEPFQIPGESLLRCCARLASVDVSSVEPYDHQAIRRLVFEARVRNARREYER